jgi:superfamily II DNA helicase RecQ
VEKLAEQLGAQLGAEGRRVLPYHAGLPAHVRAANQEAFVSSEDMVIVATVAFGMGIDKPDVRFVAHAGLPKSIEGYYQETGRAGRDGDPSVALMLWGADDFARARQRLAEVDETRRQGERTRLDALAGLVETTACRRAVLLRHFGENPPATCGNCDNCLEPPALTDATELARKLLSAVYRTGQSYGLGHLEKVLTGQADERVRARGHDELSVFGIVGPDQAPLLKALSRALLARGTLTATEHGGLALAETRARSSRASRPSNWPCPRCASGAGASGAARRQGRASRSIPWAIRCSRRCARCAAPSRAKPMCRPMWCSTMRSCAKWRPAARARSLIWRPSAGSARASAMPMASVFSKKLRVIEGLIRNCRFIEGLAPFFRGWRVLSLRA